MTALTLSLTIAVGDWPRGFCNDDEEYKITYCQILYGERNIIMLRPHQMLAS